MSPDKQYIVKLMFKTKIYELDGISFEDFFTKIMITSDGDFRKVKPHGSNGDEKNDGFNSVSGEYFQVYSPEKPVESIATAINKCKASFKGIKEYWSAISPVKKFYFVFNDKYKGAYPEIEKVLSEIKGENSELECCEPFYAQHLEKKFFELSEDKMQDVIGFIPDNLKIEMVDLSAMKEVVEYLINNAPGYDHDDKYVVPDFDDKIKFNNLSDQVKSLLVSGSYQGSAINEYFRKQNSFEKQKLKEIFVNLYELGKKEFEGQEEKDNLAFFYILKKAMPQNEKRIHDAVLILMAYYFENCDIFEEPK